MFSDEVPYKIKRYRRSRSVRIRIDGAGEVRVSAPLRISLRMIAELVKSKMSWIEGVRQKLQLTSAKRVGEGTTAEYKQNKRVALRLVTARLAYFNAHYNLPIGKLSIRNQQSRWGSCNRIGNLSFNYRVVFLPQELQDYLVVHELCHIAEHNHGPAFWKRMQETLPKAKKLRGELRKLHI
ncbi:TPA: hypothetical protein DEP96_00120 [Candidatus Uhrbacteria bacterium]|nr:hypothetical protein [Candidatus Uhrbacteria bacterium]